jgi:hypothetical protein
VARADSAEPVTLPEFAPAACDDAVVMYFSADDALTTKSSTLSLTRGEVVR